MTATIIMCTAEPVAATIMCTAEAMAATIMCTAGASRWYYYVHSRG